MSTSRGIAVPRIRLIGEGTDLTDELIVGFTGVSAK
jgi:hypothetical protein